MGTQYQDGYCSEVEGYFVLLGGDRVRVAKSNGDSFVLADPCELPPDGEGDLLVIIDGVSHSRRVAIPDGISAGQTTVGYRVLAPF